MVARSGMGGGHRRQAQIGQPSGARRWLRRRFVGDGELGGFYATSASSKMVALAVRRELGDAQASPSSAAAARVRARRLRVYLVVDHATPERWRAGARQSGSPPWIFKAFSLPFSKQYINNHLSTPIDDLPVTVVGSAESFEMRLKKSKESFTTGWNKLVQANLFELGDVCVFLFTEVDDDLCITLEVLN
uniref:TF-B3 domain-containing protein n=1 Tax=Oryza meridionalis TaxID=40149 RepID=A0A0E0CPK8_9ORYZ